jgi:hypothetical protein
MPNFKDSRRIRATLGTQQPVPYALPTPEDKRTVHDKRQSAEAADNLTHANHDGSSLTKSIAVKLDLNPRTHDHRAFGG